MSLLLGVLAAGLSPRVFAADSEPLLTLRLRDASFRDIAWVLFGLTEQGYVVDRDVIGKLNVELSGVTAGEVEQRLSTHGAFFTGAGSIRRMAATAVQELPLPGTGLPVSLEFRNGDMRDFLRLMRDITGQEILAPAGPLGSFALFLSEKPADDALTAALASAGLAPKREGERIRVRRLAEPKAVLLPLDAGGLVGHVAYRHGESAPPRTRLAGLDGALASEVRLWGLVAKQGTWTAIVGVPDGRVFHARAGYRLYDSVVESVDADGVVVSLTSGGKTRWHLRSEGEGITACPEDVELSLERARALVGRGQFEAGEGALLAALGRDATPAEARRIRAELADMHYQWGQVLSARGQWEAAVRHLEAALEIDRVDRPWQAAEDLNDVGKAWTAAGEPERAVAPHREALEIARSGAVRDAPRPFSCVREHERTPWIEADALDGLANAERARGRLTDAATLYERALAVWKKTGDTTGQSAALTGLGLVRQDLGQLQPAVRLHREALALPARHPVVRATVLNNLGTSQLALRQLDAANASFEEALVIYRRLEHRSGEGTVLNNLGALWEARADPARACETYARALEASAEADDRRGQAITRAHIERLARGPGPEQARQRCQALLAE